MAVYYFLAVECGPSEEEAKRFCEYFQGKSIPLSDGTQVLLHSCTLMDDVKNWWVEVAPKGASYGSPGGDDYRLLDYFKGELTRQLYKVIKDAPPFRYAIAGEEVEFFTLHEDLKEDVEDGAWEGLIISRELWLTFGKPNLFEPFNNGYFWIPYSEISSVGQALWFKKWILMEEFRVNEFITLKLENEIRIYT